MNVKEYIYEALQTDIQFEDNKNIDGINYIEDGYIDSFGMVRFIFELEEKFDISFTDDEMMSDDFKIVGKLIELVQHKIELK
ncbi:hypothetical protein AAGS61_19010 [Lysinibacillus sp. KU-BSD001]|uniref:hypothetical protein n=1 Tax=Lysinibacillus sp. KU-BSD001 TaxID=3141328 RepID=UPI0036E64515